LVALVALASAACRSSGAKSGDPARGVRSDVETRFGVSATVPHAAPVAKRAVKKIPAGESVTRFAVIGDFGVANEAEAKDAELVRAERPDFIITPADNN
jgi:hypothetical protein